MHPKRNAQHGNLRWVWTYVKPDWWRVALAVVLYVLSATMALVIPLITGQIVDEVIGQGVLNILGTLCIAMIALTVFKQVAVYGYSLFMERTGQNALYRLVSEECEKLHELDAATLDHVRTGELMNRMTADTDAIRHMLSYACYQGLNCIVMFIGGLAMMCSIDWRVGLALAVVAAPMMWFTRQFSTAAGPLFLNIRNSLANMNSTVEENIEGNRVVKAFVREDYETSKFDQCNTDYLDRNMAMARNTARFIPWMDGLGASLEIILIIIGGFFVMQGNMTLGGLVACTGYLWMINQPVRDFGWLVNDWQRFNASCVNIRKLLATEPTIRHSAHTQSPNEDIAEASDSDNLPHTSSTNRLHGDLAFDHVSFAYPDAPNTPVLSDITFSIPAGGRLGIVGETGSGKSTLIQLIARAYDPTEGSVLLDGTDARELPLDLIRRSVSTVTQETFLFSDSIGNNIAFGMNTDSNVLDSPRSTAQEQAVTQAAKQAAAANFIAELDDGMDTIVGERGVGLSGGQKQRISLARALASNPSILILDDTTSAVDMATEAQIQQNLRADSTQRTVVTIAHRMSSVMDYDVILVLEQGRIVERGSHSELVALGGRYAELYAKQTKIHATTVPNREQDGM